MGTAFEIFSHLGSAMAGLMFAWAVFSQHVDVLKLINIISAYFDPYIRITFPEFVGQHIKRSDVYTAVQSYLSGKAALRARRLRMDTINKKSGSLMLSIDEDVEIVDVYEGIKIWWSLVTVSEIQLKVHNKHRDFVTDTYIKHVLSQGKAIVSAHRQRKLYTNNPADIWWFEHKPSKWMWSHVVFEHPATFDTLAMDPGKKQEIINDLIKFRKGKEYYARIGKAWKRGYLLYGPSGTGKSTMIAAMANFMNYDVYDLELTTVKDNTELRRLLIGTTSKSIIVIEDIDCSLDLTGQRKQKEEDLDSEHGEGENKDPAKEMMNKTMKKEEGDQKGKDRSKLTLSGLLNFIDGLWSACTGEKIIVFTTNFVDKLDPALIRRGRMDMHIEMSYCGFEAFKVLAKNYLGMDSHRLYPRIEELLGEVDMTPADVAENLMPKSDDDDVDEVCLNNLIRALVDAKDEAANKRKGREKSSSSQEET